MANAAGMLRLLKANPTLLPAAPSLPPEGEADLGPAIERRRHDEVHACLRCGERAQCAYIAETNAGNRWLDLCAGCADAVRRANE